MRKKQQLTSNEVDINYDNISQKEVENSYKESLNFRVPSMVIKQSSAIRKQGTEEELFNFFDIQDNEEAQKELSSRNFKAISLSPNEINILLFISREINSKYLRTKAQQEAFRKSKDYNKESLTAVDFKITFDVVKFLVNCYGEDAKLSGKYFQNFEKTLFNFAKKTQYYTVEDARGREYSLECKLFTYNNLIRPKQGNLKSRLLFFDLEPNRILIGEILETFALFPNDILSRIQQTKNGGGNMFGMMLFSCINMYRYCIKNKVPYRERFSHFIERLERPSHYYKDPQKKKLSYSKIKKDMEKIFKAFVDMKLLKSYQFTITSSGEQQFEVFFSEDFLNKDDRKKAPLPQKTQDDNN